MILQLFDISKFFDRESLRDSMRSLYSGGINGTLYKLIFELNRNTEIVVKTAFGESEVKPTGENVAQGSIGGGLISALNIDDGISEHFEGSMNEVSYINERLIPLIFQDGLPAFLEFVLQFFQLPRSKDRLVMID